MGKTGAAAESSRPSGGQKELICLPVRALVWISRRRGMRPEAAIARGRYGSGLCVIRPGHSGNPKRAR